MREYKRDVTEPARAPALSSDLVLPLLQSVVTGALVGGLVAVAGRGGMRQFWLAFLVTALLAWLWTLSVAREALWRLESVLQKDFDGDGVAGVPERPVVRVEVEAGRTLHLVDFHGLADVAQLHTFARLALEGRLTEREVKAALGLLRPQWQALRDDLMARGLLAWNNSQSKRHGVSLTRRGADVLNGVLDAERLLTDGDPGVDRGSRR
jgi:hypothetical protein